MTSLRFRFARAAATIMLALAFCGGAHAFTPVTYADCSQPGGAGCRDAATSGAVTDPEPTDALFDVYQLELFFEVLGVLVP